MLPSNCLNLQKPAAKKHWGSHCDLSYLLLLQSHWKELCNKKDRKQNRRALISQFLLLSMPGTQPCKMSHLGIWGLGSSALIPSHKQSLLFWTEGSLWWHHPNKMNSTRWNNFWKCHSSLAAITTDARLEYEHVPFTMSSLTPSGQNMKSISFSSKQGEIKGSMQPELTSVSGTKLLRVITEAGLHHM